MNVSASLFVLSASLREEMGMDSIPSSLKKNYDWRIRQ